MNKIVFFVGLILNVFVSFSQTGGKTSFSNLNYHYSARNLALGGDIIALPDDDVSFAMTNPALINSGGMGKLLLSQTQQNGGINAGSICYGKEIKGLNSVGHFRYISYGKMRKRDEAGNDLGAFSPGEFILGASVAKSINERMKIGATLNFMYSQLDNYISFGNSLDIGGTYYNPDKRLMFAGVVKNLGVQWKGYTKERNSLPTEIQLAVSKKLAHAPFRFTLQANNLQRWDLTYFDPLAKDKIDPLTGDTIFVKTASIFEKTARHLSLQTELLFGKKFHLRFGFDYQRRKELAVIARPGLAGFSMGFGIYLKRFSLDYGWLIYSAAGSQHGLNLTIPLKR